MAGNPNNMGVTEFSATRIVAAVGLALGTLLLSLFVLRVALVNIGVYVLVALVYTVLRDALISLSAPAGRLGDPVRVPHQGPCDPQNPVCAAAYLWSVGYANACHLETFEAIIDVFLAVNV